MKKIIFVLAIFIISAVNSFGFSSLNLSVYDGRNIYILFDNAPYNTPVPEINIEQITGEKHFIKVFYENNSPSMNNIIFSDYVYLPDGYRIYAVIDEFNKFVIYKKIAYSNSLYSSQKCTCNCECCKNCPVCNPVNFNTFDECKYRIINEESFNTLKSVINSKSFENTKKDIITDAINRNFFSSSQLRELLSLLSFESTKIETAKYSYKKICDKQNFSVIFDVFQFESSVNSMTDWLRNNK